MRHFIRNITAPVRACGKLFVRRQWKWLPAAWIFCAFAALSAGAQSVPAGSLLLTVGAASTLTFAFENGSGAGSPGVCSIIGAGTNSAVVNFGTASIVSDDQTCVAYTSSGGKGYTLDNTIYVNVTQSGTSLSYTLSANLPSSPVSGVTWTANSNKLSKKAIALTTTGVYGSNTGVALEVSVKGTVTTSDLSQTIDFVATAN